MENRMPGHLPPTQANRLQTGHGWSNPFGSSGHMQGNTWKNLGYCSEGNVLAIGRITSFTNLLAVYFGWWRCGYVAFLLSSFCSCRRDAETFTLPWMLCSLKSIWRSDVETILHPIWYEWMLSPRTMDHAERWFKILNFFWRKWFWRP